MPLYKCRRTDGRVLTHTERTGQRAQKLAWCWWPLYWQPHYTDTVSLFSVLKRSRHRSGRWTRTPMSLLSSKQVIFFNNFNFKVYYRLSLRPWVILVLFLISFVWQARSWSPDQGLNPCSWHWNCGVLTTALPRKPLNMDDFDFQYYRQSLQKYE